MYKGNLIPADEFCTSHNIQISFISSLQEAGLIEITTIEETEYIHKNQLHELEKIVRLYYELDINLEGIETVIHLLQRINDMQDEITILKNRLRLYESYEL
ncbi:MAG: MerR family transcriptional regulator [Bacteroidia bacterium]|nr:MerR family transcriptional regulator [Bacteroidia bacterium]